MKSKAWILGRARRRGSVRTTEAAKALGVTRQTAAQHLRELVARGELTRLGSTKSARYVPAQAVFPGRAAPGRPLFSARHALRGLEEDAVWREADLKMGLKRRLSPAAHRIAAYAFTEMLNNAVDHSRASHAGVRLKCGRGLFEFTVEDAGIGAFESIRRKFRLKDHFAAVEHLLKGKQSADPKRHSGQGIFFTSKIADCFVLESAKLRLVVDNRIDDVILRDIRRIEGTRVHFSLKQKSRKDLKRLFDSYSGSDYEFDKTRIRVHLSERPGEYISRSQAKRLLFGLEKFRRVVLDFKRVPGIGQGFADEVFRVFRSAHPKIRVEPVHMSKSVEFMVRRTGSGSW